MIAFVIHKSVQVFIWHLRLRVCLCCLGTFKINILWKKRNTTQSSETYDLNSKQLFYVEELRREGVWIVLESKPAGCLYTTPCLPFLACPVFIEKYKWRLWIGRIACMPCQMLQLKHSLIRSNNQISVPHLPNPPSLQMSNLWWIYSECPRSLGRIVLRKCVAAAEMCPNMEIRSLNPHLDCSLLTGLSLSPVWAPRLNVCWVSEWKRPGIYISICPIS